MKEELTGDSFLPAIIDILREDRASLFSFVETSLTGDSELVRVWRSVDGMHTEACKQFLRDKTSVLNADVEGSRHYAIDPMAGQEVRHGIWRHVQEWSELARDGHNVFQRLRRGYATAINWDEAKLVQYSDTEQEAVVGFYNIAPEAAVNLARDMLQSYNGPIVEGKPLGEGGTWYLVRAVAGKDDTGTGVVQVVLSKQTNKETIQVGIDFETLETRVYEWGATKDRIAAFIANPAYNWSEREEGKEKSVTVNHTADNRYDILGVIRDAGGNDVEFDFAFVSQYGDIIFRRTIFYFKFARTKAEIEADKIAIESTANRSGCRVELNIQNRNGLYDLRAVVRKVENGVLSVYEAEGRKHVIGNNQFELPKNLIGENQRVVSANENLGDDDLLTFSFVLENVVDAVDVFEDGNRRVEIGQNRNISETPPIPEGHKLLGATLETDPSNRKNYRLDTEPYTPYLETVYGTDGARALLVGKYQEEIPVIPGRLVSASVEGHPDGTFDFSVAYNSTEDAKVMVNDTITDGRKTFKFGGNIPKDELQNPVDPEKERLVYAQARVDAEGMVDFGVAVKTVSPVLSASNIKHGTVYEPKTDTLKRDVKVEDLVAEATTVPQKRENVDLTLHLDDDGTASMHKRVARSELRESASYQITPKLRIDRFRKVAADNAVADPGTLTTGQRIVANTLRDDDVWDSLDEVHTPIAGNSDEIVVFGDGIVKDSVQFFWNQPSKPTDLLSDTMIIIHDGKVNEYGLYDYIASKREMVVSPHSWFHSESVHEYERRYSTLDAWFNHQGNGTWITEVQPRSGPDPDDPHTIYMTSWRAATNPVFNTVRLMQRRKIQSNTHLQYHLLKPQAVNAGENMKYRVIQLQKYYALERTTVVYGQIEASVYKVVVTLKDMPTNPPDGW